tara:strand:- start:332 stop:547 length:216 start_codon:yes stop_codon:yes gene_type:complete
MSVGGKYTMREKRIIIMSKFKRPYIIACLFLGCVYLAMSTVQDTYFNLAIAGSYFGVMLFIWRDEENKHPM